MRTAPTDRCRVCGDSARFAFTAPVLGRSVAYFDCVGCGYVQTERPYWLDEAYANAIGDADTGLLWRNQVNVQRVLDALVAAGKIDGRMADFGGGYGVLTRLLRDVGVDAYWRDRYCSNLFAIGFEATENTYDLITAFEVLEHLVDPVAELRTMLAAAPVVLVSTDLAPAPDRLDAGWWYLVPEYGQHIGFMRRATLQAIAERLQCAWASDGSSVHVFTTDQRLAARWSWLRRLPRLTRLIARSRLTSRTMTDFELVRRRHAERAQLKEASTA